jgi:ABC-type spermidine/putrescine transport system permease subunit II
VSTVNATAQHKVSGHLVRTAVTLGNSVQGFQSDLEEAGASLGRGGCRFFVHIPLALLAFW